MACVGKNGHLYFAIHREIAHVGSGQQSGLISPPPARPSPTHTLCLNHLGFYDVVAIVTPLHDGRCSHVNCPRDAVLACVLWRYGVFHKLSYPYLSPPPLCPFLPFPYGMLTLPQWWPVGLADTTGDWPAELRSVRQPCPHRGRPAAGAIGGSHAEARQSQKAGRPSAFHCATQPRGRLEKRGTGSPAC